MHEIERLHKTVELINNKQSILCEEPEAHRQAIIELMIGHAYLSEPNNHFQYVCSSVELARKAFLEFCNRVDLETQRQDKTDVFNFTVWLPHNNTMVIFSPITSIKTLYRGLKLSCIFVDLSYEERKNKQTKETLDALLTNSEEVIGL